MFRKYAPIALLATATVAGCGTQSAGTTTAAAGPPSSSAPAPAPSPTQICTTRACIVQDAEQGLIGDVAKDESVLTKMKCKPSTVRHNAGNTWTVACVATFSDGSKSDGYVNLLPGQSKITFEPTD
jgi:hypothetical protein